MVMIHIISPYFHELPVFEKFVLRKIVNHSLGKIGKVEDTLKDGLHGRKRSIKRGTFYIFTGKRVGLSQGL